MVITSLRFATACGMSDRLRLDLVLNHFAAGAMTCGEISVLSDGTPWRPLIDVADMARAIEWAATREAEHGGTVLTVNAGRTGGTCAFAIWPKPVPGHSMAPGSPSTKMPRRTAV